MEDGAELEAAVAVRLVEDTIRSLGVDPAKARHAASPVPTFAVKRGSARVWIVVHPSTEGRPATLRVASPVIQLPSESRRAELYEQLLRLNGTDLVGAAFGIIEDEVVVLTERVVSDLDPAEVDNAIRTVGRFADHWDDILSQRFETPRSSDD